LIGGQVQIMFAAMTDCIEHVRTGRSRPLAGRPDPARWGPAADGTAAAKKKHAANSSSASKTRRCLIDVRVLTMRGCDSRVPTMGYGLGDVVFSAA
jgi:hypothetical protein